MLSNVLNLNPLVAVNKGILPVKSSCSNLECRLTQVELYLAVKRLCNYVIFIFLCNYLHFTAAMYACLPYILNLLLAL